MGLVRICKLHPVDLQVSELGDFSSFVVLVEAADHLMNGGRLTSSWDSRDIHTPANIQTFHN